MRLVAEKSAEMIAVMRVGWSIPGMERNVTDVLRRIAAYTHETPLVMTRLCRSYMGDSQGNRSSLLVLWVKIISMIR